jgi:hypothetical protein
MIVAREQQPLLVAVAERMAAERYRDWARVSPDAQQRDALLACAGREDDIARRIESLYPGAAALQQQMIDQNPDLAEINRSLFAGRSLPQQFTIQARGERLGAATWRAFAAHAQHAAARDTFLTCANLEEESAIVLEGFIAKSGDAA